MMAMIIVITIMQTSPLWTWFLGLLLPSSSRVLDVQSGDATDPPSVFPFFLVAAPSHDDDDDDGADDTNVKVDRIPRRPQSLGRSLHT